MRGMDLARPRTALALLCAASFLAIVDTTIVSIALPAIRRAMNPAGCRRQRGFRASSVLPH